MGKLTDQFFEVPESYREKTRQRVYLKDIDCPQVWHDKLKEQIPQCLFYLNESTGEVGGPGALDESGGRKGRGIAHAGDLMSSLPPEMRAENLMCYIGHEGTFTPSHREMCASLGQNIMVNASGHINEEGKPEHPGSSLWFMTETRDRHLVSEYWLSILGHDIEVENHFAQLVAWKKAPFKTYVVEQRPGDLILIPPLAPHQVWNRGTRTMKIAWNRTTVKTLELALHEALPNSRIVCRDEQYKNKAIIYYTLVKYSNLIKSARAQVEAAGEQAELIQRSVKIQHVQKDFRRLFHLYKHILLSEMFAPDSREHAEFLPYDSNVTCAYCRCNIFNRFLSCKSCKNLFSSEIEDPYDVCMDCYCMGRSCGCQSGYTWVEQWKWKDLIHKYEEWRAQIIDIDGHMTKDTPLPLQEERRYLGKKTLAQVCQEQLRIRPYVDIKNPQPEGGSDDEEPVVDEYGNIRKVANKKSKHWLSKHKSCHSCLNRHPKWKMAFCSNCDLAYCYGTLFRAHDMMPVNVMENPSWQCPHCRRVCNTGACRRDPRQDPYEPKGTLLGHDTRKVADVRSVECLVDFSVSNLNWLRDDQSAMQRRLEQAEMEKLTDLPLDPRLINEGENSVRNSISYSPTVDMNRNFSENGDESYSGPSDDYRQSEANVGDDSYYPDPDQDDNIPRLGQKRILDDLEDADSSRRRKKSKQNQKRNDVAQALNPKHAPGREYQKEVERKVLEEARREDRFLLVAARMRGKSKIIKLSLSSSSLEQVRQRAAPDHAHTVRDGIPEALDISGNVQSILQSDILPKANALNSIAAKEKDVKTYRIRTENDEAYSTRKRNSDIGGLAKLGWSRGSQRFEEITVDSDEEFRNEDDDFEFTSQSRGRTSNWLARKNEGEEDLPTELPADFRDGDIRPNREKERARNRASKEKRKSLPMKSKPARRPVGRPPKKSNLGRTESVAAENVHDKTNQSGDALILAQQAVIAFQAQRKEEHDNSRAAVSAREVQENLRTKMALFSGSDDENGLTDDFLGDLPAESDPLHNTRQSENGPLDNTRQSENEVEAGRTDPPQTTNSLFDMPGMAGKKIKIVSASSKHNRDDSTKAISTTVVKAPIPTFTSVNRKTQPIGLSAFESEEDISVSAPTPTKPVDRPSGRPSMIPTRGSSTPKRGRGRPRKTL